MVGTFTDKTDTLFSIAIVLAALIVVEACLSFGLRFERINVNAAILSWGKIDSNARQTTWTQAQVGAPLCPQSIGKADKSGREHFAQVDARQGQGGMIVIS